MNTSIFNKIKVGYTNMSEEHKSLLTSKTYETEKIEDRGSIIEHGQAGGKVPEVPLPLKMTSIVHKVKKEDSFIKRGSINSGNSFENNKENSIKDALEMMQIQGSKILS